MNKVYCKRPFLGRIHSVEFCGNKVIFSNHNWLFFSPLKNKTSNEFGNEKIVTLNLNDVDSFEVRIKKGDSWISLVGATLLSALLQSVVPTESNSIEFEFYFKDGNKITILLQHYNKSDEKEIITYLDSTINGKRG